MKKTVLLFTLMLAATAAMMTSCTDSPSSPAVPQDTAMSITWKIVSPDSIPKTFHYGQSRTVQFCFNDTDGGTVALTVSGINSSFYNVSNSGDSAFLTFNLIADSLLFDSTYAISVFANGGAVDTLTLAYSMTVADTNRIGGVRKPAVGMWWIEHQFDTVVRHLDSIDKGKLQTKDTSHVYLTKTDLIVHHKLNRIISKIAAGNDSAYVLQTIDTLKGEAAGGRDSVKTDYMLIRHTSSVIELMSPGAAWFADTLKMKYLTLPFAPGSSWPMISLSFDTIVRVGGIKVVWYASLSGTSTAGTRTQAPFAGSSRNCFSINHTLDINADLLLDTTLQIPGFDTLNQGDTIATSRNRQYGPALFSPDLGVGITDHTIEIQLDTNRYELKSVRDTVWKGTVLKQLYDPRRGDTLIAR